MADDLTTPLGQGRSKRRLAIPVAVPRAVAAVLGLGLLTVLGWIIFVSDPFGGEPMVIASADVRAPPPQAGDPAAAPATPPGTTPAATPATPTPPGGATVTIIDGMSGRRQEVQIAGQPAAAPAVAADPRLIETTRHGPIPQIGKDGARPSEVYARPVKPGPGPRIAIVIGGLGIGAAGTSEAFGKLAGPVTFAFAPYGADLERWVARARGEGHEVLLQVPMEPFDYPDNDPGPQTLLTTLAPEQNVDRLHWFMSRIQGYVGIASYMGARFTSSEAALGAVLRDTAKRGLIFFDDGASARSLASQIAGPNNLAFAKADIVLDAAPTPAAIDLALGKLEALARERGSAVGVATARPASIDRIAQWVKAAESRGIVVVPLSAIANKPKSS